MPFAIHCLFVVYVDRVKTTCASGRNSVSKDASCGSGLFGCSIGWVGLMSMVV